ncbi:MAG: histidine phosphatase family protein [Chloroflexota bacterium]
MNYLEHLHDLNNTYYVLRHGKSLANDEELIVSHPADGVPQYGLTKEGRRQVASAISEAIRHDRLDQRTLIVTSDFSRARESAEIARELLGTDDIVLTPKLRERYFGTWEKQHHSNYDRVWSDDALNGAHKHNGVESTREVLARTTSLIADLEKEYAGRIILLVSHGDVLQILQTAFEQVDSGSHRLLPPLQTGEIRKLELRAKSPA